MAEHFSTTASANRVLEVIQRIEGMKKSKRDYIYPANKLGMDDDGRLVLAGSDSFKVGDRVHTEWADAEAALNELQRTQPEAKIEPLGKAGALPLSRSAETQLAAKLDIPLRYIDKLRENAHGDLAATNFRTLLERADKKKILVRTLEGRCRAILSNSYKTIDNMDVFLAAAETLQQAGADIWNARVWDDGGRFEMFAVSKTITGAVKSSEAYNRDLHSWWTANGDKHPNMYGKDQGGLDAHFAAMRLTNSETGRGGANVTPCVLRAICSNTMVIGTAVSAIHLGRRREEEGLVYAEDTQASEAQTVFLKLRDTIKGVFDPVKFQAYIDTLNGIAGEKLGEPEKVVAAVAVECGFTDERRSAILRSLFESRDLTRYGLAQAVTAQAKVCDEASEYEEASGLEAAGGYIAEMSRHKFAELVRA
jgi:hypothetical protein